VEALQSHLGGLLREREALRSLASPSALERNRRQIVEAQWMLAYALIDRYASG
jgi:hypothetical protein